MTSIPVTDIRAGLADVINQVAYKGERIVLLRRGKAVVGLVPIEDVDILEALEDSIDVAEARSAMAEARKKGTVALAKAKKELGI